MGSEKNFEDRVKRFLKNEGCYFIKYWGGGEFTKAGVPDILACIEGHFAGLELKAPNGKPSDLQLINLKKIDDAGGIALLLYPEDFNQFKEMVKIMQEKGFTDAEKTYMQLKERWVVRLASITQQG